MAWECKKADNPGLLMGVSRKEWGWGEGPHLLSPTALLWLLTSGQSLVMLSQSTTTKTHPNSLCRLLPWSSHLLRIQEPDTDVQGLPGRTLTFSLSLPSSPSPHPLVCRSENNLHVPILSFGHVGSRHWNQVVNLPTSVFTCWGFSLDHSKYFCLKSNMARMKTENS